MHIRVLRAATLHLCHNTALHLHCPRTDYSSHGIRCWQRSLLISRRDVEVYQRHLHIIVIRHILVQDTGSLYSACE